MIDLVLEIRRRADSELKPSIKLANTSLLEDLANYFPKTKDNVCKTLIKEVLFLAGEPWSLLLNSPPETIPRQVTKIYRGQTQLVDAFMAEKSVPPKTQLMYRGHPVV